MTVLQTRPMHHSHALLAILFQAIKKNNLELLVTNMDSEDDDISAIKAEVADFADESGWNVFHYAAHNQSQPIMERLVEFLKGILTYTILIQDLVDHARFDLN